MECRPGCGACCIAPSISSVIPQQEQGKAAGVACIQLDEQMRCKIFHDPRRPAVCAEFRAERDFCGDNREQALAILTELEQSTLHTRIPLQMLN